MFGIQQKGKSKQPDNAKGGMIKGKGTGTSDDIKKTVPSGSYIMPKDSTDAIGEENLARLGQPTDVNLSNGEFQLSPDQVHSVGVQALDEMKGQTHAPVNQPQLGIKSGQTQPELFFANGGLVSPYPSADDIRKASRGTNVPSAGHAQEFMGKQATATQGGPIQPRGQTFEGQARNVSGNAASTVRPAAPGLPALPAPPANGGFLANAGSKVLGAAKGLGVLHGIGSMVGGAVEGFNTSTEDYATRMGLDPNADRGEAANFGIRAAGVLSDVGNKATFGMLGNRFDDKNLNQAKANLAEQQQRFAVINAERGQAPAVAPGNQPPAPPSINQQMNEAMYGKDPVQTQGKATAPSTDPYAIQQKGNSFSYANPNAANQARAAGMPELQSSGFAGGITPSRDPQGVKNFMANTREMGPSEQQIQAAIEKQMNRQGQGFGAIRQPQAPQRSEFDEAERKALFGDASTVIKGARGLTGGQLRLRQQLIDGDASLANQRYITDANNATSQSNNTANNAANIAQTGMREQGSNERAVLGENGQNMRYSMGLDQDSAKFNAEFGLKNREAKLNETKEGFGVRNAQRVEKLNEMYDKAETDEQRQSIQQRINRLTGAKDQSGKDRYMTVGGGQEYNQEQGVMINRPQQIFDTQTGRMMNMDGTPSSGQGAAVDNSKFDSSKFKDGQVYQDKNTGQYFRWDAKTGTQIKVQQ